MRKTSAAALLASAMLLSPTVAAHADAPAPAGIVVQAGESTADEDVSNEVKDTAEDAKDGMDWGWLGLLGLLGLAGLMGRNRRDHVDTTTHRDYDRRTTTDVNRGDVHRDGRGNVLDRDGDGRVRDDAARAMDRDKDGRIG